MADVLDVVWEQEAREGYCLFGTLGCTLGSVGFLRYPLPPVVGSRWPARDWPYCVRKPCWSDGSIKLADTSSDAQPHLLELKQRPRAVRTLIHSADFSAPVMCTPARRSASPYLRNDAQLARPFDGSIHLASLDVVL